MGRGRRRAGAASGKWVPAAAAPASSAKGLGGVVVRASRRGIGPGVAGRRRRTSGAQARSMSYIAGEQGTSGAYRRSVAAAMPAEKGIATSLGLGGLGRSNAGVACFWFWAGPYSKETKILTGKKNNRAPLKNVIFGFIGILSPRKKTLATRRQGCRAGTDSWRLAGGRAIVARLCSRLEREPSRDAGRRLIRPSRRGRVPDQRSMPCPARVTSPSRVAQWVARARVASGGDGEETRN